MGKENYAMGDVIEFRPRQIELNASGIDSRVQELFPQDSPIFFKTHEAVAGYKGSKQWYEYPRFKSIVRIIDGEPVPIGMVGKKFKVVPTQDICQSVERAIVRALPDNLLQDVQVRDNMSYEGSNCFRDYQFPNLTTDVGRYSNVAFRILMFNAYDGSSTYRLLTGAIDGWCSNGMIFGDYSVFSRRHTANLEADAADEHIIRALDVYCERTMQWKRWAERHITDGEVEDLLKVLPISELRERQLLERYKVELLAHGETLWALYSAMTSYSSGNEVTFPVRKTGLDNVAAVLLEREKAVSLWTQHKAFKQLAA
jgi:hypothetical protein